MKSLILSNIPKLPFDTEEALTQLRLNIGFCGEEIKTIMITSSTPNEGKSFISLHLWRMLAELGTPVLYLDADFRNSALRAKYNLRSADDQPFDGSASYFSGQKALKDVVYHTNIPHGDIVPVLHNIANPAMLLSSPRFPEMIRQLAPFYRYIIVDTPPLSNVADALSVAPCCDGSLLVVRSGVTPRKIVDDSLLSLKRTGKPFIGFVLNRVESDDRTSAYYRRYYRSDYKYYSYYYSRHSKPEADK